MFLKNLSEDGDPAKISNTIKVFSTITEVIKLIGIMLASKILKNGNKNRKLALQYYASRLTFLNSLIIIFVFSPLIVEDKNAQSIIGIISFIISYGVSILNDCFSNSLIILYNLEVTISKSYSAIVISKSVFETIYVTIIQKIVVYFTNPE